MYSEYKNDPFSRWIISLNRSHCFSSRLLSRLKSMSCHCPSTRHCPFRNHSYKSTIQLLTYTFNTVVSRLANVTEESKNNFIFMKEGYFTRDKYIHLTWLWLTLIIKNLDSRSICDRSKYKYLVTCLFVCALSLYQNVFDLFCKLRGKTQNTSNRFIFLFIWHSNLQ